MGELVGYFLCAKHDLGGQYVWIPGVHLESGPTRRRLAGFFNSIQDRIGSFMGVVG